MHEVLFICKCYLFICTYVHTYVEWEFIPDLIRSEQPKKMYIRTPQEEGDMSSSQNNTGSGENLTYKRNWPLPSNGVNSYSTLLMTLYLKIRDWLVKSLPFPKMARQRPGRDPAHRPVNKTCKFSHTGLCQHIVHVTDVLNDVHV